MVGLGLAMGVFFLAVCLVASPRAFH
jgi:hypothetical protein